MFAAGVFFFAPCVLADIRNRNGTPQILQISAEGEQEAAEQPDMPARIKGSLAAFASTFDLSRYRPYGYAAYMGLHTYVLFAGAFALYVLFANYAPCLLYPEKCQLCHLS